jgi:para-aminobenzoate synthetase/4-amino-4-deoxychorismate lyase
MGRHRNTATPGAAAGSVTAPDRPGDRAGPPSDAPGAAPAQPAPAAPEVFVDFVGSLEGEPPLRRAFGAPRAVLRAGSPAEVAQVLDAVEREAAAGRWCVGFVRYEAAPAFDPAFAVHPSGDAAGGPLAWFAVYDDAAVAPLPAAEAPGGPAAGSWAPMDWRDDLDRAGFDARIERIHRAIADGETYQINLTSRLRSRFEGDPRALFHALHRAQPASYAAYIDTGREQLLSVSPELFFTRRGARLLARPMKGTAPRGATPEADAARARHLRTSEKERAENLMIVDLLRNDLSRVARPFTVKVPALFETRAWPTVWQMTSDVEAEMLPGATLADAFRAIFPCGSVTGVPKVRATALIRELEPTPRGAYCGAIGVVRPGGDATFSVAIRTVEVRGAEAVCGIGSGITIDADADGEWQEWRNKRAFLVRAREPFSLLETLRLEDGRLLALEAHLERMAGAVRHFGFDDGIAAVRCAARDAAARHPQGLWRMRLLLAADGSATAEVFPMEDTRGTVILQLADNPMVPDHPDFVRFKTTRRAHYDRFAPDDPAIFDTVLWNAEGALTECTRANLALRLDGAWCTPPLADGLLGGVGRAQWMASGRLRERRLGRDDLRRAAELACFNSLRGWLPARLAD